MELFCTIITIIAFPLFGIFMFKQGRAFQKEMDDRDIERLISHIKTTKKYYETRSKEYNKDNQGLSD